MPFCNTLCFIDIHTDGYDGAFSVSGGSAGGGGGGLSVGATGDGGLSISTPGLSGSLTISVSTSITSIDV